VHPMDELITNITCLAAFTAVFRIYWRGLKPSGRFLEEYLAMETS